MYVCMYVCLCVGVHVHLRQTTSVCKLQIVTFITAHLRCTLSSRTSSVGEYMSDSVLGISINNQTSLTGLTTTNHFRIKCLTYKQNQYTLRNTLPFLLSAFFQRLSRLGHVPHKSADEQPSGILWCKIRIRFNVLSIDFVHVTKIVFIYSPDAFPVTQQKVSKH